MVVLEEAAFAFGRVRNAGVLVGDLDAGNPGHLEDAPSAGLHDAVEFTQALRVVGHMLQHVVTEDDVKAVVLQGNLVQIKVHISQGGLDVGGQDLEIGLRLEALVKTLFRSDVQHGEWRGEEFGVSLQVEVEEAVALQGVGTRTQGIFAQAAAVAIGEEFAVAPAVNGVGESRARVKHWSEDPNKSAHSDQPRSGNVFEGPANHANTGSFLGSPKAS